MRYSALGPIWAVLAFVMSALPTQAGTFQLAGPEFYKLNGQDAPVFGYKLRHVGDKNFLACDGTPYKALDTDLIQTSGSCGDSRSGVTLFSVALLGDGSARLHIFSSNAPNAARLVGANARVPVLMLQRSGLGYDFTSHAFGNTLITTNSAGLGQLVAR